MRKLKIRINDNGAVITEDRINNISGEGNATEIEFSVPPQYADFNKFLDISDSSGNISQTVLSIKNEKEFSWSIPNSLTSGYGFDAQLVMKKGAETFKSVLFAITFDGGINATSYMESEYIDSIEFLYENKAEKGEISSLEKKLNGKLSSDVYYAEAEELKKKMEGIENEISDKAGINDIPIRISDLWDDSLDSPVIKSKYAETAERADTAGIADNAERAYVADSANSAMLDSVGNNIADTYIDREKLEKAIYDVKMEIIGTGVSFPKVYDDIEKYDANVSGFTAYCDTRIPAGATLKSVKIYSKGGTGANSAKFFLISLNDSSCYYRQNVDLLDGWNVVDVNCTVVYDCFFGVYGSNVKATGADVMGEYIYSSSRIITSTPYTPNLGEKVELISHPSLTGRNFALSLQLNVVKQPDVLRPELEILKKTTGSANSFPELYDISGYTKKLGNDYAMCDVVISGGSTVKSVKLYSDGGSSDGVIYLIRAGDNVCVYKKDSVSLSDGWNNIPVDYTVEEDCYFGVYNANVKYTDSGVTDEYLYSVGIKDCTGSAPAVGNEVIITQEGTEKIALALQIILADGLAGEIMDKVDIYQGENNSGKVMTVGKDGNLIPEDKSSIYPHGGIISFIDDDTGKYVPDIWGEIIAQTNIRMGFACVTGYISGKETAAGIYEPMPLTYLQELYENGHEVYSHSYKHPDFASQTISLETIDEECRKSRDWLITNGFIRNSDIIVYPGGMGSLAAEKQSVVRQHYRYGIDTVEGGNLQEPIEKPWCIYRYNADTRTLDELKALVDSAISEKKHLVFMNHAYELNKDKDNQIQKMIDLINYIKEQNGTILPFGEAVHKIHGWN